MTATTAPPLHARARFPWYVLAGAIVLQGATAPGQTVGISVFVDHFAADLDLSRSAVSSAYLVGTLSGALSMPAAGRLIDRRGVRTATLVFGAGFGAVLIGMAGVAGFVTLAIGFAGTRILGQGALTLTATTTVAVWFDERRGVANGIKAAAGSGLMALVPIGSAALIVAVGWRAAWVVLGLAAWAIVLPLGLWLIRDPRENAHIPTVEAAATFLPLTLASAGGALTAGRYADRVSPRLLTAIGLVLLGASPVLVQTIGDTATAAVYGAVLGVAGAAIRTIEATALPRWFGIASIGQIRGVVMAAGVGASALGPLIVSLGLDLFGSYTPVLNVLGLVALALAAATLFVQPPQADDRPVD